MSDPTDQLSGEQLLLARIFGQMSTKTINRQLDRRALMGRPDTYQGILESLRPLRPHLAQSKPILGTAA